jgi:hypothetical protein
LTFSEPAIDWVFPGGHATEFNTKQLKQKGCQENSPPTRYTVLAEHLRLKIETMPGNGLTLPPVLPMTLPERLQTS